MMCYGSAIPYATYPGQERLKHLLNFSISWKTTLSNSRNARNAIQTGYTTNYTNKNKRWSVYEPNSVLATPQFEKPIRSISAEAYAHRLAMFAAEHVCVSSHDSQSTEVSNPAQTSASARNTEVSAPSPEVSEIPPLEPVTRSKGSPTHTDIAGQIRNYLSEHQKTATTSELITHIGCSTEGFNKAIKKLINQGHVEKVKRGVYQLIHQT